MEINEYRIEFLNTIRNEANLDGNDVDDQFVNSALAQLEEMGELIDPYPFSCEMRGTNNRSHSMHMDTTMLTVPSYFLLAISRTLLKKLL